MPPEIAIIHPDTLACIGLRQLLEAVIPQAIIRTFRTFGELTDDTPDMYAHYFVSAQTYFEHTAFFLSRHPKTIVLTVGDSLPQLAGATTLDVSQDEQHLAKAILQLRGRGHGAGQRVAAASDLSVREVEVLRLVAQGCINKEIADKLGISLTTVISHRKNIVEKLGIHSVSGLTIYAVMHGYVEADRI